MQKRCTADINCVCFRFTVQYRCRRDVQQKLIAYFAGSPYSTDVEEMYSSDYDAPEELKEAIIVRTPT